MKEESRSFEGLKVSWKSKALSKTGEYNVANKEEEVSWANKMGEQKTGYVRGWLALQVGSKGLESRS